MKRQKRFTKEFEIETEIIRQKRKMKTFITKAEGLEDEKKNQIKLANDSKLNSAERLFYVENSREIQREANKLRRRAFLIETEKLPALKNALAEFRTEPIPGFLGEDKGVALHE